MSKFLNNLINLIFFVGFLCQFANCLSCYHCNSNLNEGCDEMHQPIQIVDCKSNETMRRNHQKLATALNVSIASQSTMYCLRVFLNDKHGDYQSYRECYEDYKVISPCDMVTKSLTTENDHIRVVDCEICERDLCNSDKLLSHDNISGTLTISLNIQLILILLSLIFMEFWYKICE
ncbi:uncharacterized protein [Chironomus tepperi]|uniref:uncharacterized protein n=1 Tax=Chironomus tepperi TaxID=113505 RepID=UPI00391FCA3C